MGGLGWTPSEFWTSTPHDLFASLAGHNEKSDGGSRLTEEQVAALQKMRDEAVNGNNP